MKFTVQITMTVEVEATRVSGKFASRDEVEDLVREHFEEQVAGLDLYPTVSGVGVDGDTEYDVEAELVSDSVEVGK